MRARERHCRTCSGGIHDSGNRPSARQLAQPPGVLAIGLRAPLATPQGTCLHRLGEMRNRAGGRERVAHEQPARARLDCDIDLLAGEATRPARHSRRRRVDTAAHHLA
jgi:hypothetical protein